MLVFSFRDQQVFPSSEVPDRLQAPVFLLYKSLSYTSLFEKATWFWTLSLSAWVKDAWS